MAKRKRSKRYFGSLRTLPSGRIQARYTGPDGKTYAARTPEGRALTFDTVGDADAWLSLRHSEILRGAWLPPTEPKAAPITLREYADAWLVGRVLERTTLDHYGQLLRDHIYPIFGNVAITAISPPAVRTWYAEMGAKGTGPTARAHAYSLLRTITNTAVVDDLVAANPCRVRGGGSSKRVKKIKPATLAELEALVTAMPERYKVLVLLAAWCGLRFGELAGLRRGDVDTKDGVLHVCRGVVRTKGDRIVKGPKSDAGRRDVNIPPHLLPLVRAHIQDHAQIGRDGLMFPAGHGGYLAPSTLYRVYYPARNTAGRPDLRFHDLRHTGAVLAAATGATLAELMARLGHSTPGAAIRYQHAAAERDKVIAEALSKLANGTVASIRRGKPTKPKQGARS